MGYAKEQDLSSDPEAQRATLLSPDTSEECLPAAHLNDASMVAASDHLEPTPILHLDDPGLVCTLSWKAACGRSVLPRVRDDHISSASPPRLPLLDPEVLLGVLMVHDCLLTSSSILPKSAAELSKALGC